MKTSSDYINAESGDEIYVLQAVDRSVMLRVIDGATGKSVRIALDAASAEQLCNAIHEAQGK